jgi:hypothetical protein
MLLDPPIQALNHAHLILQSDCSNASWKRKKHPEFN